MTGLLESAGPVVIWLVVAGFVFAECAFIIGLFLPGDSLLLTAGIALAAAGHQSVSVWALAVAAMLAAIAGNHVGYGIGAKMGDHMLAKKNGRYLNSENLHRVKHLMDRRGFGAVLVARWIPWVRTLCPMVAGAAGMNKRTYTIASVIGSIFWAPCLLLVGFYASSAFEQYKWVLEVALAVMLVVLVVGTVLGFVGYRREMAKPDETVDLDD
ncbi:DedA family protein [Tsukamurella sp. 8F]|uniref:DedA family protein n=1 Tax=unclassified Tsukamurella TaxID=2633480 RepID=UPI0023B91F8B|nr:MULTISPECIES: DedA family protein [unclassified Tsukamurella]MDF0530962.1 DedA family protein [Tsukamurella sp. 8J]MDF0588287.1 DedA family protein [Tsukamurella sp. 8F]